MKEAVLDSLVSESEESGIKTISNFVGGEMVAPLNGQYLDCYEPATGKVYARCPDSDERDLQAAVEAAEAAFPDWSQTPVEERATVLNRIAERIAHSLDLLAKAEAIDTGKPISQASHLDIPRASSNFRFYASMVVGYSSDCHSMGQQAFNYTLRQPHGVVGCISPWNLPLYLFTWKIAPALVVGNCVIGKPSELTPMSAYLLSGICQDAGLPPGVLNILHGAGSKVGAALTTHPAIRAVSFTGGCVTGSEIARNAAPLFKKVSLEMGGKNPVLVFADCNYQELMPTILRSSFANQGEVCVSGSRILIERPLYDRLRDDLVEKARAMVVGDPLRSGTDMGALISEAHLQKVLSYIELARQEGGRILTGGNQVQLEGRCSEGWFVEPTVIEGLGPQCRTNQEEIFGPVVTLQPFDSEKEALSSANATPYGLAASIWTQDISRAHRLAAQVEAGIIWVNSWMIRDLRTPFGGMKQSGVGREGGLEALNFFTEPKNVCIKL